MSDLMRTVTVSQETFSEIARALGAPGSLSAQGPLYLPPVELVSQGSVTLTPEKEATLVDLLAQFLSFDASVYSRSDELARDFLALKREARAFLSGLRAQAAA